MTTEELMAGYAAYTSADDLGAAPANQMAPDSTPILSIVVASSQACGVGISIISVGGVGLSVKIGC